VSTFTWIDHSEKQRRQILEAIDLFREKDTRDELGVAPIRDAFSDMLFPGTGALQTRARYFFFVPWMYLGFEAARVSSVEVARKGKAFELALINTLADSPDPSGTIGIRARTTLQRLPSSVYWNGLKILGISQFPGSLAQYQRSLDRQGASRPIRRNDDGEIVDGVARAWHGGLPAAPTSFPADAAFGLTGLEARYLKNRILENHRLSLFAFMLDRGYGDADATFAWEHPAAQHAPVALGREITHARCFSEVIHGAAILYNLYLAELETRREEIVQDCSAMFDEWLQLMAGRRHDLVVWGADRKDFWALLASRDYIPSLATQLFVDEWCRRVLSDDPAKLRECESTRNLIFGREIQIKGALARCENRRLREMWQGESSLGRLDFRWSNARVLLRDITAGLAGAHA
jgi:hypothetical protein